MFKPIWNLDINNPTTHQRQSVLALLSAWSKSQQKTCNMSCIRHKEPYLWESPVTGSEDLEESFITWPSQPPGVLVGASVCSALIQTKLIQEENYSECSFPWNLYYIIICVLVWFVNIDCSILQIWCSTGSLQGPSELILQLGAQRSLQILGCERLASNVVLPRHIFVFRKTKEETWRKNIL